MTGSVAENLRYRDGVSVTVSAYWVEDPIYRAEAPAKWFAAATDPKSTGLSGG